MIKRLIISMLAAAAVSSCSVTRRLHEGEYMLKRNDIRADRNAPLKERVTASELNHYVLQSSNRHFFGINLYAWLHAQANPAKNSWWHRLLRSSGEAPVVWEPAKTERSVENLRTFIASRGFFEGTVGATVDTLRRRRVRITYRVTQGPPSRIGRISYTFRDTLLRPIVMADSAATLLHTGDIFNTQTMDDERQRITSNLRDIGYYSFNVGHIGYVADSTRIAQNGRLVDLEIVVRRNLEGYADDGTPRFADHRIYRLGEIDVYSDYDPLATSAVPRDTLIGSGLRIFSNDHEELWERLLRRAIALRSDSLYSASAVAATSSELMRLGAFRSVSVMFNPLTDSGLLDVDIRCVPALRQSVGVELEGSTTSSFYGLRATVGYRNRNTFRGAELFDASLTSGFEFLRSSKRKLSYELGANVALTFPRFVMWGAERSPWVRRPVSTLSLSVNWQDRAYYSRTLFGLSWGYSWGMGRWSSFTVRPIDINFVRLGHMDPEFKQQLNNPYLVASYDDQLMSGISAAYVFNNQPSNLAGGATVLRAGLETTGNLLSGLARVVSGRRQDYYNIFGIRFAQYLRGDVSFSQKFVLGEGTALAYRLHGGAIYSYGNSTSPPFDKLFFAGGAGSMRGWAVRTLGPGTVPYVRQNYPAQMGDVKLEANVEFRFPVVRSVGGALFVDAGNIWFMRSKPAEYPDEAVFRPKSFSRQLGLNGGIGARFDIGVAILRLDWGIQLYSPGQPAGQRWIRNFRWSRTALSFGVGHPF